MQAEIVTVETKRVAIVRKTVPFAEMPAVQRSARAALDAASADAIGPSLTVWRPPVDGAIDYAPGIFVSDAYQPSGDVALFDLPSGRAAYLQFTGGYESLPDAWGQVFAACRAQGWATAGLNWEVYTQGGATPVTDLYALLS